MNRPLRLGIALLVSTAALFVALVAAVALLFEPEDYRPLIIDSVTRSTGRTFELDGDLQLELFPCCSVSLGAARLGNPKGFPDPQFAAFESAAASIKLWPLFLRREIEIGTLRIEGLDLNLVRLADGRTSWTFDSEAPVPGAPRSTSTALARLRADGLEVNGGRVSYADLAARREYTVADLGLKTGAVDYHDTGSVLAAELDLTITGDTLPDGRIHIGLIADRCAFTPATTALELSGLQLTLDDSRMTGDVTLQDPATGAARFDLAIDRLDLDRYQAAITPSGADTDADRDAPTIIPLAALADWNVEGKLRINALRISGIDLANVELALSSQSGPVSLALSGLAADGRFALAGEGQVKGPDPYIAGHLEVEGLAPRQLLSKLDTPPRTADPDVLSRLDGTAGWRLMPRALALESLRWQLDDTTFDGSLRIDDFDRRAVRFDLALDRMDLDAYLPPRTRADQAPRTRVDQAPRTRPDQDGGGAETESADIPADLIRSLNLDGRLRARQLGWLQLQLTDVEATVRAANGKLRIDPLTASLYGGTYRGTVTVDATGPKAAVALDQQLTEVQVGDLLEARYDTDRLAGALSLSLTGRGAGITTRELLHEFAGTVDFDLADGVYRGTDVLYEIRRAEALLQNEPAPIEPASRETPISVLSLKGTLADGVMQSNAIRLETPLLRLGGKGGLNLEALLLDYRLDAELLPTGEGADGGDLARLLGTRIPLTVDGPVKSPRVRVDLERMLKNKLERNLEERALELLGGRKSRAPGDSQPATATDGAAAEPPESAREPSARDLLKRSLRDLLAPRDDNP